MMSMSDMLHPPIMSSAAAIAEVMKAVTLQCSRSPDISELKFVVIGISLVEDNEKESIYEVVLKNQSTQDTKNLRYVVDWSRGRRSPKIL